MGATKQGGAAGMWAVAAQLAAIFLLSNLPTPLYEAYRHAFGFSQLTLTLIYAVYVVGTVSTMFFLGRLSDQVGRRKVVLASLGLAAIASGLFLLTTSTAWLFGARVVSGVAMALSSGASTAWILELQPEGDKAEATQVAIGATSLGLALGPLLSGLLSQYGPSPLRLSYWVFLPVSLFAAILVWRVHESVEERKPLQDASLRPRLGVPREIRRPFVTPAIAAFVTFAVLGFYSALIPGLLTGALHQTSRAVSGSIVAGAFLVSVVTIATAPAMKPRHGLVVGLALLIPGVVLLVLAEALHSMALLLVATAVVGAAAGLGYRFGLQRVNELAPEERRSEVVSSYLIVCYAAISLPVVGVGLVTSITRPLVADAIFGGLIIALAIAALIFEARPTEKRRAATAQPAS